MIARFPFECCKTKLLWPIRRDINSAINQSELDANISNRRQMQENACEQVTIGFGFAPDWLRKWRNVLLTNQREL